MNKQLEVPVKLIILVRNKGKENDKHANETALTKGERTRRSAAITDQSRPKCSAFLSQNDTELF